MNRSVKKEILASIESVVDTIDRAKYHGVFVRHIVKHLWRARVAGSPLVEEGHLLLATGLMIVYYETILEKNKPYRSPIGY